MWLHIDIVTITIHRCTTYLPPTVILSLINFLTWIPIYLFTFTIHRCTTPPPLPTLAPFSWADAHKATEEAAAKVRAEAEAREAEKRAALARKLAFLAEESEVLRR